MKLVFFLLAACAALWQPASAFAQQPAAARAETNDIDRVQYPREFSSPQGRIVLHAPQINSWTGYEMINGVSAIEVALAAMGKSAFGSISYTAKTVANLDQDIVTFYDITLDKVTFPQASAEQAELMDKFVRDSFTGRQLSLPLEVVFEYLDDTIIPTGRANAFSMAPPVIFYADSDSRLLTFDGEPMLQSIQNTDLQFVVNTNWDLFYLEETATWYLLDDKRWLVYTAKKIKSESNKWQEVTELPLAFRQLPDTVGWSRVKEALPARPSGSDVPGIFVSEKPAELILTDGEPVLENLGTSGISYVSNTESDLFLFGRTWYYLVSGRWFSSGVLDGKWRAVETLPEQFASIPADSAKGYALVSVPGTTAAKMALLEAAIPRKAEISRNYEPPVTVAYTDGKPQFERIDPTDVYRAINTPQTVVRAEDMYYLCYNAAWFVSADPSGPWKIAEQVPQSIYSIPASSPVYNCTYVYVYDSSNSNYVTTGYKAGYFNVYTSYTVVYGSGYYYRPYYYYPYYYGYYRSYGAAAWYNPRTGSFGGRQTVYGPYGGASRTAVYNPATGSYARGRAVWDSDEIARQGLGYNPRTGTGVATNRYRSEDGAWSQSLVKRDDKWVATQVERSDGTMTRDFKTSGDASGSVTREAGDGQISSSGEFTRNGNTVETRSVRTEDGVARGFQSEDGSRGGYVKNSEGDLYAGKDGNVYKREDGQWSKYQDGGWENVEPGQREPRPEQGERDFAAGRDDLGRNPDFDYQNRSRDDRTQAQPADRMDRSRDRGISNDKGNNRGNDPRLNDLNRQQRARQGGFDRYNNRRMNRGGIRRRR